jgi:hypothetical protein
MTRDARGRGRAVEAARALARTAPALVVVGTADGRVRRTIAVGPSPVDGRSPRSQTAEEASEEA